MEKELEEIKAIEEREIKELELMNENENREFYVYLHIRLDNMTPFYVGKGKRDRAYDLDRSDFHNSVRDEYDCKVVIIKDKLTESQAFRLEKRMIEYYVLTLGYGIPIKGYDDYDHNLPYLTNFTWGGEGTSGHKRSEESKRKSSESMKGKNKGKIPWIKGKKVSEEAKRKNSEAHKGKKHSEEQNKKISEAMNGEKNPMYCKHHSEEAKRKMSIAKKGKKMSEEAKRKMSENSGRKQKVICITTGKTFDCIKDAEKYYKCGYISKCCRGVIKSAGELNGERLKWKYLEDYNNEFKGILINPIIK